MKKSVRIILSIITLFGCDKNEVTIEELTAETWELIEIKVADGEWQTVKPEEKHFLKFLNTHEVKYTDSQKSCVGEYAYDSPDFSPGVMRLSLYVSCMVQDPLWWEYFIVSNTGRLVVTRPTLAATATISNLTYKYKVTIPPAVN